MYSAANSAPSNHVLFAAVDSDLSTFVYTD